MFYLRWLLGHVSCAKCGRRVFLRDPLGRGWKYLCIPWTGPEREWVWFCPKETRPEDGAKREPE
jgi:hypothetical protein